MFVTTGPHALVSALAGLLDDAANTPPDIEEAAMDAAGRLGVRTSGAQLLLADPTPLVDLVAARCVTTLVLSVQTCAPLPLTLQAGWGSAPPGPNWKPQSPEGAGRPQPPW